MKYSLSGPCSWCEGITPQDEQERMESHVPLLEGSHGAYSFHLSMLHAQGLGQHSGRLCCLHVNAASNLAMATAPRPPSLRAPPPLSQPSVARPQFIFDCLFSLQCANMSDGSQRSDSVPPCTKVNISGQLKLFMVEQLTSHSS